MNIKDKLKETWAAACRWEGINPDAKFVVFSDGNPFMKEHDKWMKMFLAGERLKDLQAKMEKDTPAQVKIRAALFSAR